MSTGRSISCPLTTYGGVKYTAVFGKVRPAIIEAAPSALESTHGSFGNRRLKYLRNTLVVLVLLAALVASLLWFLPARWVAPWVEPQLHGIRLQQVQGLVWNGAAREVTDADGQQLGALHWQLSRRALLGDLRLRVAFDGPQLTFSAAVRRLPDGRIEIDGASLRANLAGLSALDRYTEPPLGRPLGELQLTAGHVLLQGGWPLQLQAQGRWRHAAVRSGDGDLALGDMQLEAHAQEGVIRAQWHDVGGGPLQANGGLQLSPLGWRLDTTLRARQTDPALRRWLARFGPMSDDGSVHIQQRGGLAGAPPSIDKGDLQP